eukprot:14071279-Ditylum_brightwellii.AAC.1
MSCYVSSSVSAIEDVILKAVSETNILLKVMQEMDVEMHILVKEKYGIKSKGMKELRIVFKHYILAHFNNYVETKVPHTELDMVYTLLGDNRIYGLNYIQASTFIQRPSNNTPTALSEAGNGWKY